MAGQARRTLLLVGLLAAAVAVARQVLRRDGSRTAPGDGPEWPPLADVAVAPGPEHSPVRPPGGEQTPASWVEPADGACPVSHPVKAKVASGIFHSPGSVFYDRTRPDRCYRDAAAAEADGLRAAKR
jgi:hypothetical protein